MKTICFFNTTKSWGGGEKWHLETCTHMANQGYTVFFITNKNSELYKKLEHSKINHVGLNITNLSFINPITLYKVFKILKKNRVDTILINLSRDLKIAGLTSKLAKVSRIIYRRGSAIPIKNSILNRYYFKHIVTDILANSKATKKTVLKNNRFLFPKEKIKIIYNGIDVDEFNAKPFSTIYKKQSKEEIVITSLGRLEVEKNHTFLISVSKELKKRNVPHKILIGGDGSLKTELIQLSKENGVENHVKFFGFISNPKDILHSGDLFMLPSLWEGFGYVLAEAGLCKKPVIAFDTTSIPEIIDNGINGYVVEPNNVNAVADKIVLLKKEAHLRKKLGETGYDLAIQNFDNRKILKSIETYITNKEQHTKISALLITYNEIHNIDTILENLSFANEIIVVDSYSTDGTAERIKLHKKVKLIQREFKNYTDQKSFALEQASHNWVLFLDADERISRKLQEEIVEITRSKNTADAYFFYRTFMFKNEILKFSGSQSDKNYRLFKKDKVNFVNNVSVHETLQVNGKTAILKNKLIHFCYRSYKDYKAKMIRYGKLKAQDEFQKNYTPNAFHFIIKPAYKFFYNYILRLGILDGKKGIIISYLSALGVHARYKELKRLRNART